MAIVVGGLSINAGGCQCDHLLVSDGVCTVVDVPARWHRRHQRRVRACSGLPSPWWTVRAKQDGENFQVV